MWTRYLITGILSSIITVGLLSCSGKQTEQHKQRTTHFIYNNELEMPIVLEYFYSEDGLVAKSKSIAINTKDYCTEISNPSHEAWQPKIYGSDSVRIVFDNVKELWYFLEKTSNGNILIIDNYKKVTDTDDMVSFEYDINQSIYDLATDIPD